MLEKEAEKEIRMEEKEVISVEDVETILTPAEPNRTTEETKLDRIMEMFLQMEERRKEDKQEGKKQREEDKEELKKQLESLNENTNESLRQMKEEIRQINEPTLRRK